MRTMVTLALVGGLLAACGSASRSAPSTSTSSTAPLQELAFVFDDAGLHEPTGPVDAGAFRISFEDRRRNRPPGERVTLRTRPSGPIIVVDEIPAGTTKTVTLLANIVFEVAINGVTRRDIPQDGSLVIRTSPQYPTPAT